MLIASKYNVFVEVRETIIIYNTLWNTYLIANRENIGLLREGCVNRGSYANDKLFDAFIERKMIVENTIDEIEIAKQIYTKTRGDKSCFNLTINPTLACNFRCWYCYESHDNASMISECEVESILLLVGRTLSEENIETFSLGFFGGEPLLGYDKVIVPILKGVKALIERHGSELLVGITTNGSLLSRERLIFLHEHHVQQLQITLDGNRERHNQIRYSKAMPDSYSIIVRNICEALEVGIAVSLRLNISEDTALDVEELLKDFSHLEGTAKDLLYFSIHKVWQSGEATNDEVERLLSEIRDAGYKAVSYFSSPNSIWDTCYADKANQLIINPRGEIFKCTARDFTAEHVEGVLSADGTIAWNELHTKREAIATPFKVQACRDCSILPICVGGCSQRLLEHSDSSVCPLGMDAKGKEKYAYKVLSEMLERC